MTIKYHNPAEFPRCETCLLATPIPQTRYTPREEGRVDCHRSDMRHFEANKDWFCEKGLWMVEGFSAPFAFPQMMGRYQAETREGK